MRDSTTRTRRRRTSTRSSFWKTPTQRLRQRQPGLHRLHDVAAEVDGDEGRRWRRAAERRAGGLGPPVRPPARVGGAVPPPWLRATLLLGAPARVVRADLPGGAGDPVRLGVLARRLVHRRSSSTTGTSTTSRRSSRRRRTARSRCARSGSRRAVTITDALLAIPFAYFAARLAPKRLQTVAVRDRARAAVDELPRARLRVAADPRQGRDPQLDAATSSASAASTSPTRTGRCGSCSATSGCRS